MGTQEHCRGLGCGKTIVRNKHHLCTGCDYLRRYGPRRTPPITTEQQVTKNVSSLMASLPVHSHHRAPLVHHLAAGLDSKTAGKLLHCSDSYVRGLKRKSVEESDLLQDKYSRDVKRAKLHPQRLQLLIDFLVGACPTKSGEKSVTYHQYVNDDDLYTAYVQTRSREPTSSCRTASS